MRSLVNKLTNFQSFIYASDFDIICITETWLNDTVFDSEIIPTGYSIFRRDRGSRGGGVLVAVRETIPVKFLSISDTVEALTVSLLKPVFTLTTVYMPPNSDRLEFQFLLDYLSWIFDQNHRNIIVGDFNLPDVDWVTLSCNSANSKNICDFVYDHNLFQFVDSSTHSGGNILDLILADSDANENVGNVLVNSHKVFSLHTDHFLVTADLTCKLSHSRIVNNPSFVFDFKKADYQGMCSYLLDYDFSCCFTSDSVEYIWSCISGEIRNAMNAYIPKFRLRKHQRPKWMTSNLMHKLNCLNTLKKKYKSHPSKLLAQKVQSAEESLQTSMTEAKSQYESKLVTDYAGNYNAAIFRYMKSFSHSSAIPALMFLDCKSASTDQEKTALFNEYFYSTFTHSEIRSAADLVTSSPNSLSAISISEEEVFDTLFALDTTKSTGPDGIGPGILKNCAPALYIPLHRLFVLSLSLGLIPKDWRIHKITPIFKAGDKTSIRNYRPISLLCTVSLVLERLVYDKVSDHIFKSISTSQFGFRRNNSTQQQLLLFLKDIVNSFDKQASTDAVYLDLQKAFDSVSHLNLLDKLRSFGISGQLWKWFQAYLTSRYQKVSISQATSGLLPVLSGVPQGSILGPLLFITYINDIEEFISSSKFLLYADDAKCFHTIVSPSDCNKLQGDLDSVLSWSGEKKLRFNSSKCFVIHFSSKKESEDLYNYIFDDSILEYRESGRDLGVIFSANLTWERHYRHITARAYKMLGLVRRSFSKFIPVLVKKKLYLALVRSQLTYCSVVWRPQLIKDIITLESVQRRATKYILDDYECDYKTRLIRLKLLPLMMFFELTDIVFYISSILSPSINFDIGQYIHGNACVTRSSSSSKLQHSFSSTCKSNHFYFKRLPRRWNSLPVIDTTQSLFVIKLQLFNFMYNHFIQHFDASNPCTFHFVCPCFKCSKSPTTPCFNSL